MVARVQPDWRDARLLLGEKWSAVEFCGGVAVGEVEEPAGEGTRSRVLALQAPACPGLGNGGGGSRHGHCSHSQGKYRAR